LSIPPRRSSLAVPASSPRKLEGAAKLAADELILDLEDAVIPAEKEAARENLVARVPGLPFAGTVSVRINPAGTEWAHDDVVRLASIPGPPATFVIPKVESAADVHFVERLLEGVEGAAPGAREIRLQALVESAAGLSRLDEIASCSQRLVALVIGYADLAVSLGRTSEGAEDQSSWDPARHQLLMAAKANDLEAIDGPFMGIAPDPPMRAAVAHGRKLGFDGKWVIHPSQIALVNEAFSPTASEVEQAQRVVEALERAATSGGAGAVALDGKLLDKPIERAARRVLERAAGAAA